MQNIPADVDIMAVGVGVEGVGAAVPELLSGLWLALDMALAAANGGA